MTKKTYLIDLDGTMYQGNKIIDGAKEFIDYLLKNKIPFYFLTNNASRTLSQNRKHMEELGFNGITKNHFFTSAMSAAYYISKNIDNPKAFIIGKDGLREALDKRNIPIVKDKANVVVIGLNKEFDYNLGSKALHQLLNGASFIATNKDRKLPTAQGFDLGNGSIVHCIEYAANIEALDCGKPSRIILDNFLEIYNLNEEDIIMVGDNLETEIKLAFDNNITSIFVETGVHKFEDIARLEVYPSLSIKNLKELIEK